MLNRLRSWHDVSHITCLSSCLFVSNIFPVCFLCFLVFVLLAFSAPFNLCANLNMQCCNAACTHVRTHVMWLQEVELLDEVDDDDAPADIPSFEDLLEKEAGRTGRSSSVTSVPYETKYFKSKRVLKLEDWCDLYWFVLRIAASLADSGHQSHCGRLHQEDLGAQPGGWSGQAADVLASPFAKTDWDILRWLI